MVQLDHVFGIFKAHSELVAGYVLYLFLFR